MAWKLRECNKTLEKPGSLLLATTKVTDMAYLSFRERPVEFIKKEPDDKPGYVMNDHLSNSAVASSF